MRRFFAATVVLMLAQAASAHRIDEYLQATLISVEAKQVHAAMRLIPGVQAAPGIINTIDSDGDGVFSDGEQRAYAARVLADLGVRVDGLPARPLLQTLRFPSAAQLGDGLGEIVIEYNVALPPCALQGQEHACGERHFSLENHHQRSGSVYLMNALAPQDALTTILAQQRNPQQSTYDITFRQMPLAGAGWREQLRAWQDSLQFSPLFGLGMRHIAEGTDHLLFLLALLVPAPLLVAGRRWAGPADARHSVRHIAGIVSAFTVGHSITLMLAALGIVVVPGQPVEALIAVSILVSAIHAIRPIFSGKALYIAGFFGLIHGLAFAATLDRLGLDLWDRVAGIVAFNLGIEAMQMLVVAATLPSLLLLAGTRLYPAVRIAGALFAGAAALCWMAERIADVQTPVDAVLDAVARHAVAIGIGFFVVSLVARAATYWPHRRATPAPAGPVHC